MNILISLGLTDFQKRISISLFLDLRYLVIVVFNLGFIITAFTVVLLSYIPFCVSHLLYVVVGYIISRVCSFVVYKLCSCKLF